MLKPVPFFLALAVAVSCAVPAMALITKAPAPVTNVSTAQPEPITAAEQSNSQYSFTTERPAYDSAISAVKVCLTDKGGKGGSFQRGLILQMQTGAGWRDVSKKRVSVDAVSMDRLTSGQTKWETLYLSDYRELKPGRYRVKKRFYNGGEPLTAEFTILDASECMALEKPYRIAVSVFTRRDQGAMYASSAYLDTLWHELLAFRLAAAPKRIYNTPSANLRCYDAKGSYFDIGIFTDGERTWAKKDGGWYYVNEAGLLSRIEAQARQDGGLVRL